MVVGFCLLLASNPLWLIQYFEQLLETIEYNNITNYIISMI